MGKLLAHLALEPATRTILDPMAGHGDLLDAVWEAADERSIVIKRLEGIEIDDKTASACIERLSGMVGIHSNPERRVLSGSAFNLGIVNKLQHECYDLVITNPPYVRYQPTRGVTRTIIISVPGLQPLQAAAPMAWRKIYGRI